MYVDASTIDIPSCISLPFIFNVELIVDAPLTNKLVKLVLFNDEVDVAFKLLMLKTELDDNEFKLVNIVVDVAFKLLMLKTELDDNEFKLVNTVVDVAFKLLILKTELDDNEFKLVNIVVDVAFKFAIDAV